MSTLKTSPPTAGSAPLRSRRRLMLEYLIGSSSWRAIALALLSVLTGLAEAGLLAVVAQIAAALATKAADVEAHLGVVDVHMSVRGLLIVGGALALARLALLAPASSIAASVIADAQAAMRKRLMDAFLGASWAVKANDREGHLQELMTNQVSQATQAVIQTTYALTYFFSFCALVASALVLNPEAAAIVVGVSALLFATLRPLSRAGTRAAHDLSAAQIEHAGGVSEATRLAEETQVFGVTSAQRSRVDELNERARHLFFRTQLTVRLIPSLYQSAVYVLLIGGLALIYWIDRGGVASLGAVVLLLVRAGTYGNQAQNSYQVVRQAMPFIERVQDAIERYQHAAQPGGTEGLEALDTISFHHVSYSYDGSTPALTDVSFEVKAGETIGVIGPSGAGKSTLAQLLLRLREPSSGDYLIDETPAARLGWTEWTSMVSYIPQTPQLIYASVADNIRYFRPVSDEDVDRAARLAGIHDDIATWSDGYSTIVGPRAAAVSVGQAQRICLARALALRPQMLVLDEPTSALDPTSERLIQASLTSLKGSLTLFVIAHRMSTLDICDRVMVIVDGRLDAVERFDDLQSRNAYYRSATNSVL
jgi:ABC-type multidrug transport system fused ATPase/permease subunit